MLKMSEVKESAKNQVLAMLAETFDNCNAEMYNGKFHVAIPVKVDGAPVDEIWVKVDLTCAQYVDTKVSKAFNPFELQAEYEAECEAKAKEAEAKAKAREEKKNRKG
jgi:hypothetical protein